MSIRKVLSPLLMISYVCGLKVIEFPIGVPRQWSGLLYMLLLWSLYNFVFIYGEFRNCIKSLTIVDDTLEKLTRTTTDCKLYRRTIWYILGWFMIAILIIGGEILYSFLGRQDQDAPAIYVSFIRIYCIHITVIGDLTITSMIGYVGLKFDQINEYLEKLTKDNKYRKLAWGHSVLFFHQSRYAKGPSNAYIIWIVMHLYLELRKISRKIDLIFGSQMTIEMGNYFAFIAIAIQEFFDVIFIKDYKNKIIYATIILLWLFLHVFRLFLINYECERISIKANATRNFISELSYSNRDVEIRENILQFLLMIKSPFRFCGLGLFQFGFKFLQRFTTSIATVLVILLQVSINNNI
ncbi:uncharacterized protein [Polyergus mexicanus]|uniref:uncharacterized protein n=1 Tax=Polyergus mexicanus TaxID=615972 RepID=UPI0038B47DAF